MKQNGLDTRAGAALGPMTQPNRMPQAGLKPKDLVMMPHRVAMALQADGWWVRMDIVWAKPNPMPESVTDRPTKSHEYLFLLAKSEDYYCNMEAIKEPASYLGPNGRQLSPYAQGFARRTPEQETARRSARNTFKRNGSKRAEVFPGQSVGTHRPDRREDDWDVMSRNKRSVWTINTEAYAGAHFATFPPDLVRPCILAGSPQGGVVLDPFAGSGTTLQVARALGCEAWGIELNPEYVKLAEKRLQQNVFDLQPTESEALQDIQEESSEVSGGLQV